MTRKIADRGSNFLPLISTFFKPRSPKSFSPPAAAAAAAPAERMEDSISTFCKTVGFFCKHLHSTSQALKDSTDRRPIPLDSASSTYVQCLNRRVSSVTGDLNVLEKMVLGTVSFEELLGHCNEVYKKNQKVLAELENHLESFGYVPDVEMDGELETLDLATPVCVSMKFSSPEGGLDHNMFACELIRKRLEEDHIFDDSICIQDIGLSDAALATLALEADDEFSSPKASPQNSFRCDNGKQFEKKIGHSPLSKALDNARTTIQCPLTSGTAKTILKVSKNDYDKLPSYMKSLASWEDLQAAVLKMDSLLCKKEDAKGGNSLNQEEIASLDLGSKGRSYLLILLRMNQLLVETIDGSIVYRAIDHA